MAGLVIHDRFLSRPPTLAPWLSFAAAAITLVLKLCSTAICNTVTMTEASPPGLSLSPSGRELIIPTDNPAKEGKDVFISLSETVTKLKEFIAQATAEKDRIVFIRAPVAAGKTTLANYLTTKHSDEFVKVASATSEDMWYQHVIDASGKNLQLHQVRQALMAIARQGKTIVIDEAHLIFPHPNVVHIFFKNWDGNNLAPRFLLFSASGSAGDSQGREVGTPNQIARKYLWYPPNPDADKLSVDLAKAKQPVYLDVDSVRFLSRSVVVIVESLCEP